MLVVHNAGNSFVEARATLTYDTADGRLEKYQLSDLPLQVGATRFVNLRRIIASGQPDEAGRVIPPDTNFGTLTIDQIGGQGNAALVGGGATFDPDAGECSYLLAICDERSEEGGTPCDA